MKNRRFGKMRIVLCLLMVTVALGMMPGPVSATEQGFVPSKKHVDVEIHKVPAEKGKKQADDQTLPAKVDPREENWFKDASEVRDQGNTQLCWAFAATTAAKISYIRQHPGAKVNVLSPAHLGYFYCFRPNDPLGNTGGDRNNLDSGVDWYNAGGSGIFTMQHLATWSGMADERDDNNYAIPQFAAYTDADAYKDTLVLESCDYHRGCTEKQLKELVLKHGAAVASMYYIAGRFADRVNGVYYYDLIPYSENNNNHEVTVIGWDDNMPAEKFMYSDGSKPDRDGAWLVQNSYGKDTHDNGFFWMSYDSAKGSNFLSDDVTAYEMVPVNTYDHNFQYDGNAYPALSGFDKGDRASNVYTAPRQITIRSIGFTTYNDGPGDTVYDVDIYTGVTDSQNPASGFKAGKTQRVTTDSAGYHSFQLSEPVTVDKGEKFSVVITFRNESTSFGCECANKDYDANIAAGQSYYTDKGKWHDAKSDDCCFRIKAQADDFNCTHTYKKTGTSGGYDLYRCSRCGHQMKKKSPVKPAPKSTSITKIKAGKKSLTITWKRQNQTINGKHLTGYQLRYSQKKNMKSAKTVTVKGYKTTTRKLTKLKKKKTYYVQVRTCYKEGNKTYYSAWSPSKSKKTK